LALKRHLILIDSTFNLYLPSLELVFYGNITGDGAGFDLLWSFQAKAASHGYLQTIIQQFFRNQTFCFPVVSCNPGKLNQNSVRRRLLNHQLDYLIVAIGFYWHFLWQETKQ
jgi:hypothetical protein